MGIKKCIEELSVKVGLAIVKRMSPILRDAIENPENLKFEGYINGDEVVIKIKQMKGS